MKKKTVTKHALLASVLAMVLCITMLVGTTFAWFTDTASANVNKIQSGNLKIELQNKEGKSLEGETLKWVAKDGRAQAAILWEPGCTYELEPFQVVNAGNLNLKYKIAISGIQGDAKLLKAITFTYKLADGTQYDLSAEKPLGVTADTKSSGLITISGHMDENAGNEYKNLSIEGIAITVYATQDNVESDSYGPDYDKEANGNPDHPEWGDVKANVTETVVAGQDTVLSNSDRTVTATVPAGAVDASTSLTLTVTPTNAPATVQITSEQGSTAYEITLKAGEQDISLTEGAVDVSLYVGKGLSNVKLYHKEADVTNESSYNVHYDTTTGYLTFKTATFSPFTVVYDAPVAMINGVVYASLEEAVDEAEEGATVILGKNTEVATGFNKGKKLTIDASGKTISASERLYINAGDVTIKNAKIVTAASVTVMNAKLTIEKNVDFVSNTPKNTAAIWAYGNAELVFKGTLSAPNGYGICVNTDTNTNNSVNTVVIEGANVVACGPALYVNGSHGGHTVTMKDSSLISYNAVDNSDDTCVYISNAVSAEKQHITIDKCQITGETAVEVKHTDILMKECTLTATGDPTKYSENNNGGTAVGYCFATTSNSMNGVIDATSGTVVFEKCTFVPSIAGCEVFNSYADAEGNKGAEIKGYDKEILYPAKLTPSANS